MNFGQLQGIFCKKYYESSCKRHEPLPQGMRLKPLTKNNQKFCNQFSIMKTDYVMISEINKKLTSTHKTQKE